MFLLYRHTLDGYNVYHIYMNVDRQINRHREAYSPTEKYEYLPVLVVCSVRITTCLPMNLLYTGWQKNNNN